MTDLFMELLYYLFCDHTILFCIGAWMVIMYCCSLINYIREIRDLLKKQLEKNS